MCGEMGHKSFQCPKNPEVQEQLLRSGSGDAMQTDDQENMKPEFHGIATPHGGGVGRFPGPRFNNDHHHQQQSNFQPYQFHPRPQFYPRRTNPNNENRQDGSGGEQQQQQPRRALEDVVCYKVQ
jgi:hypothetical protein